MTTTLVALFALAAASFSAPLPVVVGVRPQAWLVEAVGGPWVSVTTLVGPGDSPETYLPTDAQMSRVIAARVFFWIGLPPAQGTWHRALGDSARLELVDLRHGLALRAGADPGDHGHAAVDPHVWLSPQRLMSQARTVAEVLSRLDPEHQAAYAAGRERVLGELGALDRELAARLAPFRGRAFFVFHPSWGYFADDYGLRQVAIEIDGKEPTDRELTRLQAEARAAGARTIFVQPQVSGRTARALAVAVGAELLMLDPLAADVPAGLRAAADRLIASFTR